MTADMSEEAITKRKLQRHKEKLQAEQAWENMNNEGTLSEREYWMHGYRCGMKNTFTEEDIINFAFDTYCYISELMKVPFHQISENKLHAMYNFEQFKKNKL